jgi:hypothetical protein
MAEADRDDTPPGFERVLLREAVRRKIRSLHPSSFWWAPQDALSAVCQEIEERKIVAFYNDVDGRPCFPGEFRFQGPDGRTRQGPLPDFWLNAEFDSTLTSATWVKTERVPNRYYPFVRADCLEPIVTWLGDPRSRSEYLEQKIIVTIRDIKVLVPRVEATPAVKPVTQGKVSPIRSQDPKEWLEDTFGQWAKEGKIPSGRGAITTLSADLAKQMAQDHAAGKVTAALKAKTIANRLREYKLWPASQNPNTR